MGPHFTASNYMSTHFTRPCPGDCPVCGWPGGGAGGHDDHAEECGIHDPLPGWRILTYGTLMEGAFST